MFDVNDARVPSRCGDCGGTIPHNTKKLRFRKSLGSASVNESLCRNCFVKKAQEMLGYATTLGDRILHVIVEDDAQGLAKKIVGRELPQTSSVGSRKDWNTD